MVVDSAGGNPASPVNFILNPAEPIRCQENKAAKRGRVTPLVTHSRIWRRPSSLTLSQPSKAVTG